MIVKLCKDFDYVKSVMVDDDEMFDRVSDDYTNKMDAIQGLSKLIWLECVKDGDRVGLSAVLTASSSVLNIHIHIPKKNRGTGTLKVGREFLRWVVDNSAKQYVKINTKVPMIYRDVIRFAHKLGFKDEGIDRLSIMKNGKLVDRLNMGITFDEVLQWAT